MMITVMTGIVNQLLVAFRPAFLLLCAALRLLQPPPIAAAEQGLGIHLPRAAQVSYWTDSHGGFHGDGCAYAELDVRTEYGEFDPVEAGWQALPLSEDVQTAFYGSSYTEADAVYTVAPSVPTGAVVPEITDGYWILIDRQDGKGSIFAESRTSQNFTAALYDADMGILYYLDVDT